MCTITEELWTWSYFLNSLISFQTIVNNFSVLIFESLKDGLYWVIPVGGRKKIGEE